MKLEEATADVFLPQLYSIINDTINQPLLNKKKILQNMLTTTLK